MFAKWKAALTSLVSEDSTASEDLVEVLKSEDYKLRKERRNYPRKSFLKILKKTLILKLEIKKSSDVKEIEEMARQAKIDDVSIPVFDGVNFTSWKFRLMNILEYKDCEEPAKRAVAATDDQNAWEKSDPKAKSILISAVSDKQVEYISECKTTFEKMSKLEKIYSTQSTSLQIINRGKLEEVKLFVFC